MKIWLDTLYVEQTSEYNAKWGIGCINAVLQCEPAVNELDEQLIVKLIVKNITALGRLN